MQENFVLQTRKRNTQKENTKTFLEDGWIPAVVYGEKKEAESIAIERKGFVSLYQLTGESSLVYLQGEDQTSQAVLIQDYQLDPLRDQIIHADFRRVDLTKPITAEVQLHLVGESAAVRELGGTLICSREFVQIRALPEKLVKAIDVDLSLLKSFDDIIRLENISLPEGLEIVEELTVVVAAVVPPRTEAEMKALDQAVEEDVSSVESTQPEKKVEEEAKQHET